MPTVEMKCLINARIKEMRVVYMGKIGEKTPYIEVTALLYPKVWKQNINAGESVCVPEIKFKAPYHLFNDPIEEITNEVLGYAIPVMDGTNTGQISDYIEEAFQKIDKKSRPEKYI